MKERLKKIRKYRNMNQKEFSTALGIAQSTIGMMEVGKREILERHIRTICSIFNVNEEWFRYGKGNMFKDSSNVLQALADEYRLDMFDIKFIEAYSNLRTEDRKSIVNFFMGFTQKIYSECIPEEITDYNSKRVYRAANTAEDGEEYSESEVSDLNDERMDEIDSAHNGNSTL